ncbi:GntR family transcriptional regulator [Saccharopolyspora sp. NPDC047091]|uniref:GntR family transcriptional regulator n=1 Tax=Saccharopolyspora sp. NPDC047091 TaxID=3155924 RepID=UPI0033C140B9
MVNFEGKPAYLQIADELRQQILDGRLASGAKIPSESELMAAHDVSRTVAKMAIGVLRTEGLIYSHPGKGSFVRVGEPLRRRTGNRYRRQAQPPFASDASSAGKRADWEFETVRESASPVVAERLKITPGDQVMRTSYRYFADGKPIQVSTSYEPLSITGGTDIELPEEGPVVGVIARMDHIGRRATHVDENVTARTARDHEAEQLGIPENVQVFAILRTHFEAETPLETCDIVVPSDRYELVYRIPVEESD